MILYYKYLSLMFLVKLHFSLCNAFSMQSVINVKYILLTTSVDNDDTVIVFQDKTFC